MTGSTPAGSTPVETGPAAPVTAAAQPEAVQTEPCAALPEGRVQGREAFRQAVRDALACAAEQGWPELIVSDPDYSDWPLGEAGVVASLYRWARPGRQFTMLAGSYGAIERLHPRFVPWRRDMAHLINCRILQRLSPSISPARAGRHSGCYSALSPPALRCCAARMPIVVRPYGNFCTAGWPAARRVFQSRRWACSVLLRLCQSLGQTLWCTRAPIITH